MDANVIVKFKEAAVALQQDPRFLAMAEADRAASEDAELQDLLGEFNITRMNIQEEQVKSEPNNERLGELNLKTADLYNKIMGHPKMLAYEEAKKEAEQIMVYVDAIIQSAMAGEDPMEVEEPSASCSGSCASCAGCH